MTPHMVSSEVWHFYREIGNPLRQESANLIVGPDNIVWKVSPLKYSHLIGLHIDHARTFFYYWNLEII